MASLARLLIPLAGLCCAIAPSRAEAKRVVYINTDPVVVLAGAQNDPATNTISVGGYTQTSFAGWNGATVEQRQELLHLLKQTTVYWDVVFTLERPVLVPRRSDFDGLRLVPHAPGFVARQSFGPTKLPPRFAPGTRGPAPQTIKITATRY